MSDRRRILITGANRGLGRALAEHYLETGDQVTGCSRGSSDLVHDRYTHFCLDVADAAAVQELFKEVRKAAGGLDVLVNNAGVASMNPIALTPIESARRVIDTNLVGTFLFTHAAIRLLRSSPAGRIVNVTSIAVPLRLEGEALYAASKSAIETFTRITAKEVALFGITCNAVGPSPVRTALTERIPDDKMKSLLSRQAIARWADPRDVVNVVDFFLRPESAMVTGQVVYLGGNG
jgi:3-oxoacyl-[acyl-carrier protein] reductase